MIFLLIVTYSTARDERPTTTIRILEPENVQLPVPGRIQEAVGPGTSSDTAQHNHDPGSNHSGKNLLHKWHGSSRLEDMGSGYSHVREARSILRTCGHAWRERAYVPHNCCVGPVLTTGVLYFLSLYTAVEQRVEY
jgi:hypothetical protein